MNKKEILKIVESLISKEVPLISNLANLSKVIYDHFDGTCWAGFYLCDNNKNEMYLGPFQGPVACTKISYDKGVCGACVSKKQAILVPDVHKFPGHIACYSLSLSEVVVPIFKDGEIFGVIDLDSTNYNNYNNEDVLLLEEISKLIEKVI